MKKLEDIMRKFWRAIVTFIGGFVAWCSARATGIRNWCTNRHQHGEHIRIHNHHHRVIPFFVIIIIIIWANKEGLFKEYAGLQAFVDMFLYVIDQFYQFAMKMIKELVEHFNVPKIWEDFQRWFWAHWLF